MTWDLFIERRAQKALARIEKRERDHIANAIRGLACHSGIISRLRTGRMAAPVFSLAPLAKDYPLEPVAA